MSGPVVAAAPLPSPTWSPQRVAIVGVGLLGGSFALALRERYRTAQVIGVSRSAASRDAALQRGAVDQAVADPLQACDQADLVVLATPVDRIAPLAIQVAGVCHEEALITDLGSTKGSIVAAVHQHAEAGRKFVGAHPIAGSEKTGAQHARADLFAARQVVLTPIDRSDPARVQRSTELWRSLGAHVVVMTPEDHDRAMAAISHVPHLVAAVLAGVLEDSSRPLVGNGWLDTTRIASGDPELWTAICRENAAAILAELDRTSESLAAFRAAIAQGDHRRLQELLARGQRCRDEILAEAAARSGTGTH